MARAIELVDATAEALDIIDAYEPPGPGRDAVAPGPGSAAWATEAPRGLIFHAYELDERGLVAHAQIVPPTSQNQAAIEADLAAFAPRVLDLPKDEATLRIEQLIRSYDPCISCATHFLRAQRGGPAMTSAQPASRAAARPGPRRATPVAVEVLVCGSPDRGDDGAPIAAVAARSRAALPADVTLRVVGQLDIDDLLSIRPGAGVVVVDAATGIDAGRRRRAAAHRADRPARRASVRARRTPSPSPRSWAWPR